jgi:hypothetical protein
MISPQTRHMRAIWTLATLAVVEVARVGGIACIHIWPTWSKGDNR